jgi:HK97 family phage major capsid protein
MPNLQILRDRLSEIETEFRSLHTEAGDAALSDEAQTRWEALDSEEAEVRSNLKRLEEDEARKARIAEQRARWGTVQVGAVKGDTFDGISDLRGAALIDRAKRAVAEVRYEGPIQVQDIARESAEKLITNVRGAAQLMLATSSPDYLSAFRSWLSSGGSPVYTQAEANAVRASMSLTSANGGYVLPFLLDPTLIHTGTAVKNPIRGISKVVTGTQNTWHGVTVSNVTTAWKGEGSAFTDGSPTTGGLSITAAALTAYVTASYELFQDSDLQGQLPGLIAESIDFAEQTAFISGSGSTAPKGVVTAISATAGCTVTATTRGTFDSTSAVDTFALLNSVASRYEDNVTWVGNKATLNKIRQQTFGTAGAPLVNMLEPGQILGSPWKSSSDMVSATTSGNVLIVLGDFSKYYIYDRLGVNLEFIPNVVDGSGIPTGQRGLVAVKRVGADVVDLGAFRFLKC